MEAKLMQHSWKDIEKIIAAKDQILAVEKVKA